MPNSYNHINPQSVLEILTEPVRSLKADIIFTDDLIHDDNLPEFLDYTAGIDLNENFSIIISVEKLSADIISPKVFGFGIEEDDGEMYDEFAKEFLNIISGNCKTKLGGEGLHFDFSIPETLRGSIDFKNDFEKTILRRTLDFEGGKILLLVIKYNSNNKEI